MIWAPSQPTTERTTPPIERTGNTGLIFLSLRESAALSKENPSRLSDLKGFGPKSEEILARVNIHTVEDFMAVDPYQLYAQLKDMKGIGLNSIYAIIGAQENIAWLEVAQNRKTEILMRLDDMGIAP